MGYFFEVIYLQFYLFYKWLPGGKIDIHFNIYAAIGVCMGFIVNFILNVVSLIVSCEMLNPIIISSIFFLFIYLSSLFYTKNRVTKILKTKPTLINNKVSIIVTILYFIFTIFLFISMVYFGISLCK